MSSIYNQRESVIDNAVTTFVREAKNKESELSKIVFRIIRRYNNKDLTLAQRAQVINEIEIKIYDALRKSDYKTNVEKYMESLKKIQDFQKQTMQIAIKKKGGKIKFNELQKFAKTSINDNFLGKGLESNVVDPLRDRISTALVSGSNNEQLEAIVSNYFESDEKLGRLTRYVKTIANDTLHNYAGLINNEYRKEYNLTKFRYIGSIINDSRGQCRYWTSKEELTVEELEKEIPIAIAGGALGGFQCSGMKEWTNIDNFTIERGGYNCVHEAIPVL